MKWLTKPYYNIEESCISQNYETIAMHLHQWDRVDASYVSFDRDFASRLRNFLFFDNPIIPMELLRLIRPKEYCQDITIVHNFGDIILYPDSIVFRVCGCRVVPYILPYQVPLKVGYADILR